MSDTGVPLGLFDGFGVEIEYMIVDRRSLAVRPVADQVLKAATGHDACDFEDGPIAWSNELVLHLIELKMNGPTPSLAGWAPRFDEAVADIGALLVPLDAMLLPGAMHPTMDPRLETRLWPHENREIYAAYDRIFGCHQHGWANLQSVHLNLPFDGNDEFGRLHAACRAILPLLPAVAASSPMMDGHLTGRLDSRLHVYCTHQARVAASMGDVVPEPIWSRNEYERLVLERMYGEVAALDCDGVLRGEFLNARGAIPRFERNAIEIRLLDVQEHPRADLALCLLVASAVRALTEERWLGMSALRALPTASLRQVLDQTIDRGEETILEDDGFLAAFGTRGPVSAADLWRQIAAETRTQDPAWHELGTTIDWVLSHGPLARRLLKAYGDTPSPERVDEVMRELASCLTQARFFTG